LIDRYFEESRRMDSFGPILNPTLYLNRERQRVDEAVKPVLKAAAAFSDAVADGQTKVAALCAYGREFEEVEERP
jgi:hypothetical protein